jgi:hypothetical protein
MKLSALPSCLAAQLAPRDRPFSLTFLPDCRFPGCLPPQALPLAFSSALASGSALGPSFRFELPTLADCRLSGISIRLTLGFRLDQPSGISFELFNAANYAVISCKGH